MSKPNFIVECNELGTIQFKETKGTHLRTKVKEIKYQMTLLK